MTTSFLGLVIEGLVAVLLILTIGYCIILNRRLKRLRTDEATMRAMIAELVSATETAERAIAGLKATVDNYEHTLSERLRTAERFSTELERQTGRGERVLSRIIQIAGAAGEPADAHRAVETAATAQAIASRARLRSSSVA